MGKERFGQLKFQSKREKTPNLTRLNVIWGGIISVFSGLTICLSANLLWSRIDVREGCQWYTKQDDIVHN